MRSTSKLHVHVPICSVSLMNQWTMTMTILVLILVLQQLRDCYASPDVVPVRHYRRLPTSESNHQFSFDQKMALQQVVRAMMGFGKDPPPSGLRQHDAGGSYPSSGGQQVAPRYMHRLYEKYRIAEAEGGRSQEMADTVRNIHSDLAIVNNGSLFVFNLTSLGETETVLRAEIHIYKRRLKVSNESCTAEPPQTPSEPGFITIKAYELGPRVLRERAYFRLPQAGHSGWNTFDVTSAIKSCFFSTQRSGSAPHMLALSFAFDDNDDSSGRSRTRSNTGKLLLSRFVRKLSRPFLMVFSQENRNNSLDAQLDHLFRRGDERLPNDRGSAGIEEDSWRWDYDNPLLSHGRALARRKNRPRSSTTTTVMWNSPSSEVQGPRRQNISDDEIFLMDTPSHGHGSLWNTSVGRVLLQKYAGEEEATGELVRGRFYHAEFPPDPANVPAKSWRRKRRQTVVDNEIPQDVTFPDADPIPQVYYNLPKTNPGILRGRSHPGKKDQSSTPPPIVEFGAKDEEWQKRRGKKRGRAGEEISLSALLPRRSHRGRGGRRRDGAREVCGRRKLVVDFAEIGWREWIISPRSFEAHYCDGFCSYPMAPRLRPTNHATIQSIVRAIGLKTEVPSPCCIPATLSSVTLLYFDQNQNVVLKNYPDMTVRSCACR